MKRHKGPVPDQCEMFEACVTVRRATPATKPSVRTRHNLYSDQTLKHYSAPRTNEVRAREEQRYPDK